MTQTIPLNKLNDIKMIHEMVNSLNQKIFRQFFRHLAAVTDGHHIRQSTGLFSVVETNGNTGMSWKIAYCMSGHCIYFDYQSMYRDRQAWFNLLDTAFSRNSNQAPHEVLLNKLTNPSPTTKV